MQPLVLAFLALSVTLLGIWLRVRAGHLRQRLSQYRQERLPLYMRNASLSALPVAGACLAIAMIIASGGGATGPRHGSPNPIAIATSTALFGASLLAMVLVIRRPPDWAKPDWLRREDAEHGTPAGSPFPLERAAGWIVGAIGLALSVGFGIAALVLTTSCSGSC